MGWSQQRSMPCVHDRRTTLQHGMTRDQRGELGLVAMQERLHGRAAGKEFSNPVDDDPRGVVSAHGVYRKRL